jgi:hypothetical protein
MKHIRIRISDLLDQHAGSLSTCKGCTICTEIEQLRKHLDRDSADKFKHILQKGQDMTKSDLAFLLDCDVPMNTIRKAVRLPNEAFYQMMRNLGFKRRRNNEMALNITVDEFVQLHHIEGKKYNEIAQLKGIKPNALATWKWSNKANIEKSLQALNLPVPVERKPSESKPTQDNSTAEHEREIKQLKTEIHNQSLLIKSLQEQVQNLENIDAACEDIELELDGLREELEQERTSKELIALENRKLKELLKFYL